MVRHIEEMIRGAGGLRLFTQRHEVENPRGAVVILHGYCEHCLRYSHVVERFLDEQVNCYLLDHRGHGRSEGPRAAVLRFEEYLEDLDIYFKEVRTHAPKGPLFMLGHSMGGLIACAYALSRKPELSGIVLSSPFLGMKIPLPPWKKVMAGLLSKTAPSISMKTDLDPYLLSHDSTVVEDYIADPAVAKLANSRWYTEATKTQESIMAHAGEWRWPSLFLHGGDDRIADPDTTRRFGSAVPQNDIKVVILEGLYHEIFNEVGRAGVLDMVADWMRPRLKES